MSSHVLDAALSYAKHGWSVFPCRKDKKPYVKNWPNVATTDEHQIQDWWAKWPNAMIGLVMGKASGLWALDIDRHKKAVDADGMEDLKALEAQYGSMSETMTQKTPSGGLHLLFLYPTDGTVIRNSVKTIAPGIDVRGDGGYIIMAPSENETGRYELKDVAPVDAPAWLLGMVAKKPFAKQTVPSIPPLQANALAMGLHPYVEKVLNENMRTIAEAKPGSRNDTLFKMVAALGGFISTGYLAEDLLQAKAEEAFLACHPDDYNGNEFEKTFASAVERGKANSRSIPDKLPVGFRIVKEGPDAGLWHDEPAKKEDAPPVSIRVGAPLFVLGMFRDDKSSNWGKLLEWTDPDGTPHRYPLTEEQLASSDAAAWRSQLAKGGYSMGHGPKCHDLLARYLTNCQPERRLSCVSRTGWHGDAFVLPDKVLPASSTDSIVLLTAPCRNPYTQGGTLEGWQQTIGTWVEGNSRLLFALCASFAAPLLEIMGQESGGFNWTGASSTGKTTALFAAASAWGKGSMADGYMLSWRGTDNGLEAQASLHSDTPLCLDELSQVSSRVLQETSYMLGNSQGKSRANRRGGGREIQTWRTIFLSTGEQGLADKLAEDGRAAKAGQTVRMLDIPADAGADMGLFENLHGFSTPQEFADAIKLAAATNYGHAGATFVAKICEGRNAFDPKLLHRVTAKLYPQGADGQVKRVASRFALCWIAGHLAAGFGILPVTQKSVKEAVERCFQAWLDARGCSGAWEDKEVVERVKAFIGSEASRFQPLVKTALTYGSTTNRAGFQLEENGRTVFYILREVFIKEVCKGISPKRAAKALLDAGLLIPESATRLDMKLPRKVEDLGRPRVYAVCVHES